MISSAALDALVAAGATKEMIIATVKAEITQAEAESERRRVAKRAGAAERQRRSRASRASRASRPVTAVTPRHTVTSVTDPQEIDFGNPVQPTSSGALAERLIEATAAAAVKKKSLHTSKEKTSYPRNKSQNARTRAKRLPPDFELTPATREFALGLLLPSDVDLEFAKFKDHWLASAGRNATKLDWNAAWRNWARIASQRGRPTSRSPNTNKPRSWRDERAEDNYRASKALNEYLFRNGADDQTAGDPPGGTDAGVVLDLEPAQSSGLHAGAGHDADEIPFFNRRAGMRNGS